MTGFPSRRTNGSSLAELLILLLVLTLGYVALHLTDMGGSLPSWDAIRQSIGWLAQDFFELSIERFDQLWDTTKTAFAEVADFVRDRLRG